MDPALIALAGTIAASGTSLLVAGLKLHLRLRATRLQHTTRTEIVRMLPPGSRLTEHHADGRSVRIDVGPQRRDPHAPAES